MVLVVVVDVSWRARNMIGPDSEGKAVEFASWRDVIIQPITIRCEAVFFRSDMLVQSGFSSLSRTLERFNVPQ